MKNFLDYLKEAQKIYEFKIKFANHDPSKSLDRIKQSMASYAVDTISEVKHLPIMENNIDFPSHKNAEVFVMEVSLKYPVMANQLQVLLAESLGIPAACVSVVPSSHPEELWRNNEGELREYVQGEDVLTKPYPDTTAEQKSASEAYAKPDSILKELTKSPKFEIAGSDSTDNKTTNDIPASKESPIKGK